MVQVEVPTHFCATVRFRPTDQKWMPDESPCHATVFRWFKEFAILKNIGRNSLQDEEHTGKVRSALIPDNVSTIRKVLMDDNLYLPNDTEGT
ncbi:UNVERIFIED_CONTAM: hypothetical protein NCL1_43919 [Trichonephila clavipes]